MKKRLIYLIAIIALFENSLSLHAQKKQEVLVNIEKHDKAVYVLQEEITNPFIELSNDGYYYLTGTTSTDKALNKDSGIRIWRSSDLSNWERYYDLKHEKGSSSVKEMYDFAAKREVVPQLLAPEAHYVNDRWVIVHTSNVRVANLMLSNSQDIKGSYTEPLGLEVGFQVDPTIFVDEDSTPWLLSNCTQIRKIKKDFSDFDGGHKLIGPKNRQLGFEGTRMVKVANKYVLFGTSWSTDVYGKGTYNLYYSTSDHIMGPYTPRKFAGRFLGGGSPFQDKNGRWWALAYKESDHISINVEEATSMDLSHAAYTINKRGLTLVPLDVQQIDGEIVFFSKDPNYRFPGNEEVQQF